MVSGTSPRGTTVTRSSAFSSASDYGTVTVKAAAKIISNTAYFVPRMVPAICFIFICFTNNNFCCMRGIPSGLTFEKTNF